MPRVNHDADTKRLVDKYGVKPAGRAWKKLATGGKITSTKRAAQVKSSTKRKHLPKRTWLEVHREHLRWKKTPEYTSWRCKQFLRQGGTCYYCDLPLSGSAINDEHVIPKIHGGDNRKSNLVLACWRCNKEKNTKMLSQSEREALKAKNRKKRGTYHTLKEQYPTEYELAMHLRNIC